MKQIHIGKQIKEVFDKKGFTVTEFAKRINKSRENIYSIFKRKTIDTGLLQIISGVLEYDFFTLYSSNDSSIEIERLQEQNKLLREMNSLLKSKVKAKK
ncbi:MAG: helix-turn-helix domain-containing protein [Bacteroidota bacterium]